MANLRAKGSFVTYVDGNPISVADGDEFEVPDEAAKGLIEADLAEDPSAKRKGRARTRAGKQVGPTVLPTKIETDKDAHTNPKRAHAVVRASLDRDPHENAPRTVVEVDEAAHTDPERSAPIVRAVLDQEPPGEVADRTHVETVVEVDEEAHTDPERAADVVRAVLEDENAPTNVEQQESQSEGADFDAHVSGAGADFEDHVTPHGAVGDTDARGRAVTRKPRKRTNGKRGNGNGDKPKSSTDEGLV